MTNIYYATFGLGQKHEAHYVKIHAENEIKARLLMFEHFKDKWAFMYDSVDDIHPLDRCPLPFEIGEET